MRSREGRRLEVAVSRSRAGAFHYEEDPIDEKRMDCPECGEPIGLSDQTCQKCGEPLSFGPNEVGVHCAVCAREIGAYTETCPECGETGYPALRPRRGRKWKGSLPEGLTRA